MKGYKFFTLHLQPSNIHFDRLISTCQDFGTITALFFNSNQMGFGLFRDLLQLNRGYLV